MKVLEKSIYRIEDVEIDVAQNCLKRNGTQLHLRAKTFQVLLHLIENRQRVVTKDELIEKLWQDTAVTDDAIVQCLKEIRKALDDDSRQPRFVKTIPKVGYRFINDVEESFPVEAFLQTEEITSIQIEIENEESGTKPKINKRTFLYTAIVLVLVIAVGVSVYAWRNANQATTATAETTLSKIPGKKSLIVMPFDNRSASSEIDWLREGLADMLITNLTRSNRLSVLSRQQLHLLLERIGRADSNTIKISDALILAQKSQAEVFILGSFAKLENKIRVDAQIHDSKTGNLIASEGFTADSPEQILTQIDSLSLKLSSYLGAARDEKEIKPEIAFSMTNNLDAYRYYSLALEHIQMYENEKAVALLEKAIALDPQFAMAHARIGYVYGVKLPFIEKAKPYFEKAFQLSDRLNDKEKFYLTAWSASINHDVENAIQTYQQIIELYPLEVEAYGRLGYLLHNQGKGEEALQVLKRAVVIDSESKDLYNKLGSVYLHLGKQKESQEAYERYVQLSPDDPNAYDSLANCHQWFGRYDKAVEYYNRALSINPEFGVAISHLGNTYFWQGRYREAIEQYERYIQVAPTDWNRARGYEYIAFAYRKKGDIKRAAIAANQAVKFDKTIAFMQTVMAYEQKDSATQKLKNNFLGTYPFALVKERGHLRGYYYQLGFFAIKEEKPIEATEHFKEALKHHAFIWHIDSFEDCLANAYLQMGNFDNAIAEYERILQINPNYPLAHYHLAQAYEQKGEHEKAKTFYEKFLQVWRDADSDIPELIKAKQMMDL